LNAYWYGLRGFWFWSIAKVYSTVQDLISYSRRIRFKDLNRNLYERIQVHMHIYHAVIKMNGVRKLLNMVMFTFVMIMTMTLIS
jgi:hypothetical protein